MDLDYESIFWYVIFTIVLGVLLYVALFFGLSEKYVRAYELSGAGGGAMYINVNVENDTDSRIPLIGVDYFEAVRLVDSLNQTLEKK